MVEVCKNKGNETIMAVYNNLDGTLKNELSIGKSDKVCVENSSGGLKFKTSGEVRLSIDRSTGDLIIPDGKRIYLRGNSSTDGSVRCSSQSSGTYLCEKRESGTWSAISTISADTVGESSTGAGVTINNLKVGDAAVESPTAADAGRFRYRTVGNYSYCDMVMQVGPSSYAWTNVITNSWT
jgi:hypothetical protein